MKDTKYDCEYELEYVTYYIGHFYYIIIQYTEIW